MANMYDENQKYSPPGSEETLPTEIIAEAQTFDRIIDAVEAQEDEQNPTYPVTIEDGKLTLDVEAGTGRNSVWGSLEVQSVEGPDVSNQYFLGFDDAFDVLSGEVEVQIGPGPDNDQMVIVKHLPEGGVVRVMVACMSD